MSAPEESPLVSLGKVIDRVSELRDMWGLAKHKELWFRGESRDYKETILRPELYRPAAGRNPDDPAKPLKPTSSLLRIENDLYDEFQRTAIIRTDAKTSEEEWDWDSYFLMQHHNCPTRLLDWSDGALMALHFAVRNKADDDKNACVYVLESYRLAEKLKQLPDIKNHKEAWKQYIATPPVSDLKEDQWEYAYLPDDEEELVKMPIPNVPLVLISPHITPRIAAQRSQFIVFGTEPNWLADEFKKTDSTIKLITIAADARPRIRQELRDCGVTESVIYPDLDGLGRELRQLWDDRRDAPEGDS